MKKLLDVAHRKLINIIGRDGILGWAFFVRYQQKCHSKQEILSDTSKIVLPSNKAQSLYLRAVGRSENPGVPRVRMWA